MKHCSQKQDLSLCWILVFIMTTFLLHLVSTQPQVYFKASLPAKSLPRIGRRSDIDSQYPIGGSMDPAWNDVYNNYYNSYNNPRPDQMIFWKKMLAESSGAGQDDSPSSPGSSSGAAAVAGFGAGRDLYRGRGDKK